MKSYYFFSFFIILLFTLELTGSRRSRAYRKRLRQWSYNRALERRRTLERLSRAAQQKSRAEQVEAAKQKVQPNFVDYYSTPLEISPRPVLEAPPLVIQKIVPNPELYNTQFLKKRKDVRELLLATEGFSEEIIKNSSKKTSALLYKIVPDAQYAFVCFGGWGMAKEFLAPLYEMLKDQPCNIFLCDTRNINQSLIQNMWEFGMYSEQDALQCIAKAHELTPNVPLVIWGTCAGAFYATRALVELNASQKLSAYNVAGLIFDSGWGAVDEAIVTQWKGRVKERIARTIVPYTRYKDYRETENTMFVKVVSGISDWLIDAFSFFTINPLYRNITSKTNLINTIDTLTIPIFFIHSKDDWVKPLSIAKKLYEKASNKMAWWIELPSTHAMHHFKHKQEYKERCIDFVNTKVLSTP